MTSSDRTRILVYLVFFLALIMLAAFYRPADAYSRPAKQTSVVLPHK